VRLIALVAPLPVMAYAGFVLPGSRAAIGTAAMVAYGYVAIFLLSELAFRALGLIRPAAAARVTDSLAA
jgi:hypothetical protein